jgi:hypothetical protein
MATVIEVGKHHDAVHFNAVDATEGAFDESWLQEALRRYPELLPVEEFGPVFHPLVSIGREVPTTAGSIDNLFISHAGYPVLVETKLWRNPEAKREVVAQLIDYATAMSQLDYTGLNVLAAEYLRKYEGTTSTLQDWVETRTEPVDMGFQRRVSRNLKLGRFLLLIVTDHERPAVVDMLKRVSITARFAMDMAVVELRPFKRGTGADDPVLLVPYIAGRTEITERSIVEVTVPGLPDAQIAVRQDRYQDPQLRGKRIPLNSEDAFWELMDEHAPKAKAAGRTLIDAFRADEAFGLALREASIVVEAVVPGKDVRVSLFFLSSDGKVRFWPGTVCRRLAAAGLSQNLADDYVAGMRGILGASTDRREPSRNADQIDSELLHRLAEEFVKRVEEAST